MIKTAHNNWKGKSIHCICIHILRNEVLAVFNRVMLTGSSLHFAECVNIFL